MMPRALGAVLNENDIDLEITRPYRDVLPCPILEAMRPATFNAAPTVDPAGTPCPAPLARAPRASAGADRLQLPPPSLQGALVALVTRDTRTVPLDDAQRMSHFPASVLVAISWYRDLDVGLIGPDQRWQSFGSDLLISGSRSQPLVSWAPTTGWGAMACFHADAAQALFGVDLAAVQDRFVPVEQAIDAQFAPLWQALRSCPDEATMGVLEQYLAPRWQALQGRATAQASLRQLGRNWVERLAWQAQDWSRTHSARHVERRVKAFSGRSLREWQSLVRTEGVFYAASDRHDAGQPFDWAGLAHEHGFADQAHMNRMAKRITGFAPGEFAQRFIEDESFWVYRLWV
jgi:AraC-like DNA-binding protein